MNSLWLGVSCLLYYIAAAKPPGCKHQGTTYAVGETVPTSMSCLDNSKIVLEKECLSDGVWSAERDVDGYPYPCGSLTCVELSPGVACVAYGRRDDSAILDRGILDNVDSSNWQWIGLNVLVSVVTSLCVIALCLTSYYAIKSLENKRNNHEMSELKL
eukprot:194330_1